MSNFEDRLDTIFEAISTIDNNLINKARVMAKKVKSQIAGSGRIPNNVLKNIPKAERSPLNALDKSKNEKEDAIVMQIAMGDEMAKASKRTDDQSPDSVINTDIHDEITAAINEYFDESYE